MFSTTTSDAMKLVNLIEESDILDMPDPHRSWAMSVYYDIIDGNPVDINEITASSSAPKDGLMPKHLAILGFLHSWRGDPERAEADASYMIERYMSERFNTR